MRRIIVSIAILFAIFGCQPAGNYPQANPKPDVSNSVEVVPNDQDVGELTSTFETLIRSRVFSDFQS